MPRSSVRSRRAGSARVRVGRECALREPRAEACVGGANAFDLDDVGTDAENHAAAALRISARYMRTVADRPNSSASAISAWPIDTSSTPGTARRNDREVRQIQVVAGIDSESGGARRRRRCGIAVKDRLGRACRTPARTARCKARHDLRRAPPRAAIASRQRIHEETHAYSEFARLANHRREAIGVRRQVPAVVRGERAGLVRNECALMRLDLRHEVQQTLERIAFDVELACGPGAKQLGELGDIRQPGHGGRRDADVP